jgi:hypothetical protein
MLIAIVTAALTLLAGDAIAPQRVTALFNGKDLTGWYTWLRDSRYQDPRRVFTLTNGQIRISGEEWGGLTSRESFRDFHLIVEWRWGTKTWGTREKRARDSGILIHATGKDGAAGGTWLESIESQIIEGGTGDIILVGGDSRPSLTATVRERQGELYWDKQGQAVTRDRGRINWWGRSPAWKDELGFRGSQDIEKSPGQWNRHEIYAQGGRITYVLNGSIVNQAHNLSHRSGKIQIQSEGAELFVRKVELRPLLDSSPLP